MTYPSHDLHACVNVLMHIDMFSGMYTSLGSGDILVHDSSIQFLVYWRSNISKTALSALQYRVLFSRSNVGSLIAYSDTD